MSWTFVCTKSRVRYFKKRVFLLTIIVHWDRQEMCAMSKASEIANNVWLGPTPDPNVDPALRSDDEKFDILIEASDFAQMPEDSVLRSIAEKLDDVNEFHLK